MHFFSFSHREGRLIGFAGPNTAKEFLEKEDSQRAAATAVTPEQRVDEIAVTATDKVRQAWQRNWKSGYVASQKATNENVDAIVTEEAKNLADATEKDMGMASDSAFTKIRELARGCKTRVAVLREKQTLYKRILSDLTTEYNDLNTQAASLKQLYGFFSPGNRSALISQAEGLKPIMTALSTNQAEVEKEYSKTLEGQIQQKAEKDKNAFIGEIERRAPQLLPGILANLAVYLSGEQTTNNLEDAIASSGISVADQQILTAKLRALRDGPQQRGSWWLRPSPTRGTVGVMTATGVGAAVFGADLLTGGGATLTMGAVTLAGYGVGKLARRSALWWKTGHTSEKDLWQKSMAASFTSAMRERGDLNGTPEQRFQKLEKAQKGTEIRVALPSGTLTCGFKETFTANGGTKFARIVTSDGKRGAIDLTNPDHHFAYETAPGVFTEKNLKAPDVSDKTRYNLDALYLMAA